jgi:transcriptional regulator with XRE-family HTH domain
MPVKLRLRELRDKRGLSQRELAAAAGVSPNTIATIETDRTKGIDFETLERLAKALRVHPRELIILTRPARPPRRRRAPES